MLSHQGLTLTFQSKVSKGLQASKIKESKQKVRSSSEKQQNGWRLDADEQSRNERLFQKPLSRCIIPFLIIFHIIQIHSNKI